jgi:membrane fusion protein, multidrug efflux system
MSTTLVFSLVIVGLVSALAVLFFLRVIARFGFLVLAGIVLILGGISCTKVSQIQTMTSQKFSLPPEPVTTAEVTEAAWNPLLPSVGSLTAVQGVTVAAQLDGNLAKIAFESGSKVKAGDLLVQQDVSSEEAQLRAAEAAADLARINLERSRQLLADATVSQSQFDSDQANYKQAVAQADNIRATIAKKTILAPFSGRLGIRLVNLGQTLKAGDPIVSLQALDPIYVDFYLPQQDVARIGNGTKVRVTSDARPDGPIDGEITAINPDVDSATRNVRVEATLANPDESLHPGMFVDVDAVLPGGEKTLVIPSTAVLYAPYGDSVFVVEEQKNPNTGNTVQVARQQFVRLGEKRGDFVAVISGLKAGETVVTTGAFKLRNGVPVTINNTLAPDAKLAPNPQDS